MTSKFAGISISRLGNEGSESHKLGDNMDVNFVLTGSECNVICYKDKITSLSLSLSNRTGEFARLQDCALVIAHSSNRISYTGYYFKFESNADRDKAYQFLKQMNKSEYPEDTKSKDSKNEISDVSSFDRRTDDASASQYFQFYGYLSQQQNMMQDYIRTSTYQRAILDNFTDFSGKVILDVGAGSGILSFFAIQAGASRVYAIEASAIAAHAETLIDANGFSHRIKVLTGKVEDIDLPEKVDVIISEPMGYMLFNERMLETYLHSKKWLKPEGKMFPSKGILFVTPFTDEALYMEQISKCNFWAQSSFYAVDLSSLREEAIREYFRQPVVDNFDVRVCLCKPIRHTIDFQTADETDLHQMRIPIEFKPITTAVVHGLAFWFDVLFDGSNVPVWLSTAPTQPLTHWYQVRCLMPTPLVVSYGQTIEGFVDFTSNTRQSYDIDLELRIVGTNQVSRNSLDLKNPFFRYTGQLVPAVPPGNNRDCPTETFFNADTSNGQSYPAASNTSADNTTDMQSNNANSSSGYSQNFAGGNGSMYEVPQQYYSNSHTEYYTNTEQGPRGAIYFGDAPATSTEYRPSNCNINNDTAGVYFAPMEDYNIQAANAERSVHSSNITPVAPAYQPGMKTHDISTDPTAKN